MKRTHPERAVEKICGRLNNSGASIVFALFGLMIAAMVSVVIVGAAWMNAQRAGNLRDEEQAYLTATSIAGIVYEAIADPRSDEERMKNPAGGGFVLSRSEIEVERTEESGTVLYRFYRKYDDNDKYSQAYTKDIDGHMKDADGQTRGKNYSFSTEGVPTLNPSSPIEDAIRRTVWAMARSVDISGAGDTSKLTLSVDGKGDRMTAELTMVMDEAFNLTMTLVSKCVTGSRTTQYEMVMRCYASQTKSVTIQDMALTTGTGDKKLTLTTGTGDEKQTTAPRKIVTYHYSWPADMFSAQRAQKNRETT